MPTSDTGWISWANTAQTTGPGYTTGAGGVIVQQTSKSTPVILNTRCGQITMNASALAASAKVSFAVNNSLVTATDIPLAVVVNGVTANAYRCNVTSVSVGSFTITVENITSGSLSQSPVIGFAILKAVSS
jgi:hypothetical protein